MLDSLLVNTPLKPMHQRTTDCPALCAMLGMLVLLLLSGCGGVTETPARTVANAPAREPGLKFEFTPLPAAPGPANDLLPRDVRPPRFEDSAESLGLLHQYDNGASPKALMVESTGGGCGWLDYDRDGRLDLYLTQGGLPDAQPQERPLADVLSRQHADGTFSSVAAAACIDERGYGHGVAIGDVNNDGFDDLFVANVGANALYINRGDGTFESGTDWLQGAAEVWSSSAAWGDIDRDGDLDLYVCNYAIYDPYDPIPCLDKDGIPSICHPRNVEPEPDKFYLNSGDGQLIESSQKLGLFGPGNKGLGVVIADFSSDGWPDIYVANDTTANFLFINENGKSFDESALLLGGAFSATGATQASMGIGFGDYDGNLLPDLCLTHFTGESNTLYQNLGPQGLQDVSGRTGLRDASLSKLAFGIVMNDFNADGAMDLLIANGHIDPRYADNEGSRYLMEPQLLSFDGAHWQDLSEQAGPYFQRLVVGRAVATADFDGDGWLDACVVHHNSPTALLHNVAPAGHYLRVGVIGVQSNRTGIGARITVKYGDRTQVREIAGGTSYAASHETVADFGLGDWSGKCHVSIAWPSGSVDSLELDHADQFIVVREGEPWNARP